MIGLELEENNRGKKEFLKWLLKKTVWLRIRGKQMSNQGRWLLQKAPNMEFCSRPQNDLILIRWTNKGNFPMNQKHLPYSSGFLMK